MQNLLLPSLEDETLTSILEVILFVMILTIVYMLYKNVVLAWNTLDMMVTLCFLVYVNTPLPEHLISLLRFFNLKWWGTNPEIISYFFSDIEE